MTAAIVIIGLAASCASTGSRASRRGQYNIITAAHIAELPISVSNAREVVRRLRPGWTDPVPGGATFGGRATPRVYLNGNAYGGVGTLRTISASAIETIRYYSPRQATMRWGTGHAAGVIMVTTG